MKSFIQSVIILFMFIFVIFMLVGTPESGCDFYNIKFVFSKIIGITVGYVMIKLIQIWNWDNVNETI